MVLYYSLCFSDYLEFSQFKKSITLKTIPFEGSCRIMYLHIMNLTARHIPDPDNKLVRFLNYLNSVFQSLN